ncbi:MAG: UDP-N-acetylmuramyl pentapeptide phosphotransferase/UDP-N-acetylglucosamine-1-phosphate transferase, UDP-N-acetylglucosamine:undecaprenyl-P N-acetylglucosaminyl 1-P transferase [Candidatus Gottesmanbacteria bacterium GW2011_GWA2_43_14]|uniref:UDP-N-acetylmuramyl pentapeptide phosphotransferase/UDP-N-acetylglucosamine-1-phosphate transferase, UDP-N-acetylglucosamine:undecaprenyl-P N-acetylglucosaminyl 1-P transferase n=1 Tax=Candidatus Gottesmanbacteria bacterium GW2011_GWA2_43_14 TaxID=1618443 RepID=A0A0G1DK37_9BACT|nr:MAG: UDP-N-acetylmuramyl pentapeptide phosphotransferase/UDP-N-acetylglucosamine-1-phosphate transferase, UDP-N-acetylglucosamine:undecaprenyl-P N-acetylglucosaminyl 1-P transferase [Candidatus Gottesmanbacteria bacterium GW2011_GWA2_43_14]
MFLTFSFLISLSFLVTFLLVPPTIKLASKYKLLDDSKKRPHPAHTHTGIIPRAGGIPLLLGIFLPLFIFLKIQPLATGIFLGALILILSGLWDDRKDRSPYLRFFINCLAAAIVILGGINIPYVTSPFGGIIRFDNISVDLNLLGLGSLYLSQVLAFIWIVWTTNIIGWSGGVDGQLPGFVSISAVVIGMLSIRYIADPNQYYVTALAFLTAGSYLGFLPWNYYPQKIMPGYGGKTLAGFMLGVLSILSFSKFGTALLVLAVPMTDAVFILGKRILSGASPVKASSEHLHHHLLKLGWGKRRIALFYWAISFIAGTAALSLNPKQKVFAFLLIVILVAMLIVWLNFFKKLPQKTVSPRG